MAKFTVETASEMGKRSFARRLEREKQRASYTAKARSITDPIPQYELKTLARVRLQLDQVFEMFCRETDPGKLDRLAAAQSRLAEQERILAGRPMPGSLKPSQPKPKSKPSTSTVQLVPEPEPEASMDSTKLPDQTQAVVPEQQGPDI